MDALGGLSPQKRGRGQETVLKAKLPFSETSQVPGAAGNTVRIFFCNCKNKTKQNKNKDCCSALGEQSQGALEGSQRGLSAQRWETAPRGCASTCFTGPWAPL